MDFEYKILSSFLGDIDLIKDESKLYWELICVVPLASDGILGKAQYYFKREI